MEALQQLQRHLPPWAFDAFRLCVWLVLLVVIFVPLERLWAQHPQKIFRRGFLTDLGYYFLNGLLPKLLLTLPLSAVAWTLHHSAPTASRRPNGADRLGRDPAVRDALRGGADRWRIRRVLGPSLDARDSRAM